MHVYNLVISLQSVKLRRWTSGWGWRFHLVSSDVALNLTHYLSVGQVNRNPHNLALKMLYTWLQGATRNPLFAYEIKQTDAKWLIGHIGIYTKHHPFTQNVAVIQRNDELNSTRSFIYATKSTDNVTWQWNTNSRNTFTRQNVS